MPCRLLAQTEALPAQQGLSAVRATKPGAWRAAGLTRRGRLLLHVRAAQPLLGLQLQQQLGLDQQPQLTRQVVMMSVRCSLQWLLMPPPLLVLPQLVVASLVWPLHQQQQPGWEALMQQAHSSA